MINMNMEKKIPNFFSPRLAVILNFKALTKVHNYFKTASSNALKSCTHIEDMKKRTRVYFSFVEYYIFKYFLCEKGTTKLTFQIGGGREIFTF